MTLSEDVFVHCWCSLHLFPLPYSIPCIFSSCHLTRFTFPDQLWVTQLPDLCSERFLSSLAPRRHLCDLMLILYCMITDTLLTTPNTNAVSLCLRNLWENQSSLQNGWKDERSVELHYSLNLTWAIKINSSDIFSHKTGRIREGFRFDIKLHRADKLLACT